MLLKERKEEEKEAERIRSELGSSKGLMQEREREEEEDGRKKSCAIINLWCMCVRVLRDPPPY